MPNQNVQQKKQGVKLGSGKTSFSRELDGDIITLRRQNELLPRKTEYWKNQETLVKTAPSLRSTNEKTAGRRRAKVRNITGRLMTMAEKMTEEEIRKREEALMRIFMLAKQDGAITESEEELRKAAHKIARMKNEPLYTEN